MSSLPKLSGQLETAILDDLTLPIIITDPFILLIYTMPVVD